MLKIKVNDIDIEKMSEIASNKNVNIVSENEMLNKSYDIYAPCALGATLNDENIEALKCEIIAGGANNQLEKEGFHYVLLKKKNILKVLLIMKFQICLKKYLEKHIYQMVMLILSELLL